MRTNTKPSNRVRYWSADGEPAGWDWVTRYLSAMEAEGRTATAISNARRRLRVFLRFLEQRGRDLEEITEAVCWDYQAWLLDTYPEQKTVVEVLMLAAQRLARWLERRGILVADPMEGVDIVHTRRQPPRDIYTESEMAVFLEALGRWEDEPTPMRQAWRYRFHVMAEVQYASGMRLDELLNLTDADVDLRRQTAWVALGKGKKRRMVYLTEHACRLIEIFQSRMRAYVEHERCADNPRLFRLTKAGERYNRTLHRVASRLGLADWYNHKFRHAFAYHLLRAGCPIRYIQTMMGHEQLGSTEVYTKVDAIDIRRVLDLYHPRGTV